MHFEHNSTFDQVDGGGFDGPNCRKVGYKNKMSH